LAGLTAALNILDRGGKVVIMEKEHLLGGNSNKASSGFNAFSPRTEEKGDYLESFKNDTIKWAGDAAQLQLIETLVSNSGDAVAWLKERAGVDLSLVARIDQAMVWLEQKSSSGCKRRFRHTKRLARRQFSLTLLE
jgi:succinate dehydrogenase/fumarate reductase flavoprotein subunit